MWPFTRKDGYQTLSRRLDDAESTIRSLKTEWLDTLERLDRVMGRMVKRDERAGLRPATQDGAAGPEGPSPPPTSRALADVMKRRAQRAAPSLKGG